MIRHCIWVCNVYPNINIPCVFRVEFEIRAVFSLWVDNTNHWISSTSLLLACGNGSDVMKGTTMWFTSHLGHSTGLTSSPIQSIQALGTENIRGQNTAQLPKNTYRTTWKQMLKRNATPIHKMELMFPFWNHKNCLINWIYPLTPITVANRSLYGPPSSKRNVIRGCDWPPGWGVDPQFINQPKKISDLWHTWSMWFKNQPITKIHNPT